MTENARYIEWQKHTKSLSGNVAEVMQHWQPRFELGTAVLLCEDPAATIKLAQQYWQRLTRQSQKQRETKTDAKDILQITRTISRMQRVSLSSKSPEENPEAKFYVLSKSQLSSLPVHCFTLYSIGTLPESPLLHQLPEGALVVSFGETQTDLPGFYSKSVLKERIQTKESSVINWLRKHGIKLDELSQNIEKSNEALDTLLSSSNLQSDFLLQTNNYLRLIQFAQPVSLTTSQQQNLEQLRQLEHQVRVLSPAFLSDHIVDSQSDDSFLLRDIVGKKLLTLESLKAFIAAQYHEGHQHLAAALEQKAGFIKI